MAKFRSTSVDELERALDRARAESEREAAAEAQREAERAKAQTAFEKECEPAVAACEKRVRAWLDEAALAPSVTPGRDVRHKARAWLRGTLGAPALMAPEEFLAAADPRASLLLGAARDATVVYDRLSERRGGCVLRADLAERVDAAECSAWRAFVQHVRRLAGESEQ
jgi:hypothetical protein